MTGIRRVTAVLVALFSLCAQLTAAPPADWSVQTADGSSTFALKDARGKFVALHFLLKTECPICLRHTRDYAAKAANLPDVQQVFLKPDAEPEVTKFSEKLKASTGIVAPPIYRDNNAQLAKAYQVPDGYKFHGETVHYPALILLNPDGKEVFRYVGKNNSDRFPFEQLQEKMRSLQAPQLDLSTTGTRAGK